MYIDPEVHSVLEAADPDAPDFWELTPAQARAAMADMVPGMLPVVDLDEVRDVTMATDDGDVEARLYRPDRSRSGPLLVWFHGGGWEIGSIETSDRPMRRLARDSGFTILSVEYRLAPEHPFPAGLNDCYAATVWAAARAADDGAEIGADPTFLAVGGDSSGGNLAAAVAQLARDRDGPRIDHQMLVYPVVTPDFDTPSYHAFADGHFLTRATMQSFWQMYVGDGEAPPYADLYAVGSLERLPEATIITCGLDPLRDEGEEYAGRLGAAGVATTVIRVDGLIHGAWNIDGSVRRAAQFGLDVAYALRRAAADPRQG